MYLLTRDTTKTAKAKGTVFVNAIMFLEPGGWRCPSATVECLHHCLRTAGRLRFTQAIAVRCARTELYRSDPVAFMEKLYGELRRFQRYCEKNGKFAAVRLNGLSDLDFTTVYRDFPEIQFYEYTKRPLFVHRAMNGENPLNVHYTLSWTGGSLNGGNGDLCQEYLDTGGIVAQISTRPWTCEHSAFNVTDGDRHDLRFLDPKGSIARLKPKGSMCAEIKRGEHFQMVLE